MDEGGQTREELERRLREVEAELDRVRDGWAADVARFDAAEAALRRAEARIEAVVGDIPIMLCATNKRGSIVLWNRECERVTGYAAAEAFEYPGFIEQLFPDEEYRAWVLREGLRRSWATQAWELDVTCKDGSVRTISVTAASQGLYRSDWGACAIGLDVTDRLEEAREKAALEEQLHRTLRMESIGRLAGGVAHDFNNLLTAISCATDGLAEHIPSWDPRNDDLEEVRAATRRATELTRKLLAFCSRQVLAPSLLDLGDLVTQMKGMITRLVGEDLEVVISTHDEVGTIQADSAQMEQVVMNLVINAREAMVAGGLLSIEVYNINVEHEFPALHGWVEPGPHVVLIVSDTGVGIEPDLISKVFEPFFTTKDPAKGTGLGLATVYGIVAQSRGQIVVESDPGIGTTFEVYLPRVDAGSAPPRDRGHDSSPPPQGVETILYVEDDGTVRRLVTKLLERAGYVVLVAASVKEALETAAEHSIPIDLLVTDVVLPGGSGRTVADVLVQRQPHLSVLYLSGYPDERILDHGVDAARLNFLHKPFKPGALLKKVRAVLDERTSSPPQA